MNLVILKAGSQYGVLRLFADHLYQGFVSSGCNVSILDMKIHNVSYLVDYILNNNIDLIVNMNGYLNCHEGFSKAVNSARILVYSLFVDHPVYVRGNVVNNINKFICSFVCPSHLDSLKFLSDKKINSFFLPHGGFEQNSLHMNESDFLGRKNSILFMGTSYSLNEIKPWCDFKPLLKSLCDSIYHRMVDGLSFEDSFSIEIMEKQIKNDNGLHVKMYNTLFPLIYSYYRKQNRFNVIDGILKHGLHIDAYGSGCWELFSKYDNFNYHGEISVQDSLVKIRSHKFLLNDCNFFPYGSHERIFNGMCNGAITINYRSKYYNDTFDNEQAVFFDNSQIDTIPAIIESLISDDKRSYDMAMNGLLKSKEHTWARRTIEILNRCLNSYTCGH